MRSNDTTTPPAYGIAAPVLLVPAPLRWLLSRFLRRSVPSLKVVSNSEVPETRLIRVSAMIAATPG